MRTLLIVVSLIALAGCDHSPAAEMVNDTAMPDQPEVPPQVALPQAIKRPPVTGTNNGRRVRIANDGFIWSYSYPAAVGAIPELRQIYDEQLADTLDADKSMARSVAIDRRNRGRPMVPLSMFYRTEVVANLPAWLSLSSRAWEGLGNAQNDPYSGGRLWDKTAKLERQPIDLFVSKEALACAIDDPVLAWLKREPAHQRMLDWGKQMRRIAPADYVCLIPVSYGLILGSTNGRTFDRLGVLIQPLSGGTEDNPRTDHAIELTLPVNEAILQAVKTEYRQSFTLAR
jgi:hypothetical protein